MTEKRRLAREASFRIIDLTTPTQPPYNDSNMSADLGGQYDPNYSPQQRLGVSSPSESSLQTTSSASIIQETPLGPNRSGTLTNTNIDPILSDIRAPTNNKIRRNLSSSFYSVDLKTKDDDTNI